jgi:hypothetical protein
MCVCFSIAHVDPGRDVEDDRVRVAEREDDLLALELRAVADADDVELALEAVGDAGTALATRLRARPWNLPSCASSDRAWRPGAVDELEGDAGGMRLAQLPFGPLTRRRRRAP